jgi:hypothetical protein
VHDHTSILKLIETKWNRPALTLRDANADNHDSLDLRGSPAFREPPRLAAPGVTAVRSHCEPGQPGVIPAPAVKLRRSGRLRPTAGAHLVYTRRAAPRPPCPRGR